MLTSKEQTVIVFKNNTPVTLWCIWKFCSLVRGVCAQSGDSVLQLLKVDTDVGQTCSRTKASWAVFPSWFLFPHTGCFVKLLFKEIYIIYNGFAIQANVILSFYDLDFIRVVY
jgi:hypothetical protein